MWSAAAVLVITNPNIAVAATYLVAKAALWAVSATVKLAWNAATGPRRTGETVHFKTVKGNSGLEQHTPSGA